MNVTVRVFEQENVPGAKAKEVDSFTVEASGIDNARDVVEKRLADYGWRKRSLNFSKADGSEVSAVIFKRE